MVRGDYIGVYKGNNVCGFIKGHSYKIEIDNNGRTYVMSASEDKTEEKLVDFAINYASETSIRRNWDLEELNMDLHIDIREE